MDSRNYLVHRFFERNSENFMLESGRKSMIHELRDATGLFQRADRAAIELFQLRARMKAKLNAADGPEAALTDPAFQQSDRLQAVVLIADGAVAAGSVPRRDPLVRRPASSPRQRRPGDAESAVRSRRRWQVHRREAALGTGR